MSSHKERKKLIKRVNETRQGMTNTVAVKPLKVQKHNVNKKPAPTKTPYQKDSAAPGFKSFEDELH